MKICTTCGAEWPDDTKFCPKDGSALRAPGGEESLIGGILQSYHIIKKLGEGGMGAVYLGEHVKMGRKSAIKVMTQSLTQDADAIARFNREAANAASINHVNVCSIYDFGETEDGTIFLAMEYIEGEALTDIIKREGPLDLQRAGEILKQTGDALQAAHELGIVHRDLKPDNIMVAKARDGSDLVKVVDFGIAKAMGGDEGQDVTRTGLVVGTPEYMSPEQLSGDVLDGRSDVYSLALVFFRMITGALPFEADSAQEAMIKRLTDEPARLHDALPEVAFPLQLQAVLDKAMERMPPERYATADEFAADVLKAAANAPAPASAPPVDLQGETQLMDAEPSDPAATEQLKKTRLSEAQATVAMSELDDEATAEAEAPPAATAVSDTAHAHTAETPKPKPTLEAQKKPPFLAIAASVVVVGIVGGVGYVTLTNGGDGESGVDNDTAAVAASLPGSDNSIDSASRPETVPGETEATRPLQPEDQGRAPTESSANTTPQPNADSLALELRIEAIIENILEPETVVQARAEANEIFADPNANAIQKAQVAYQLAVSYDPLMDLDGSSQVLACRWIGRALERDQANPLYSTFQEDKCNL